MEYRTVLVWRWEHICKRYVLNSQHVIILQYAMNESMVPLLSVTHQMISFFTLSVSTVPTSTSLRLNDESVTIIIMPVVGCRMSYLYPNLSASRRTYRTSELLEKCLLVCSPNASFQQNSLKVFCSSRQYTR